MRIPFKPMALGAAALARSAPRFRNETVSTVLMTTTGKVFLSHYDGASFTTTLNATITGAPTWVEFVEPNLLYAVDEWDVGLRLFHLDFHANGSASLSEPVATAEGSSGVVHLEFNQDKTRMVGSAYGGGAVDIWDVSNGQLNLLKTIESEGELGPVQPNQAAPHPHEAVIEPSGRYFAVNDLGTDEILIIDSKDDAYDLVQSVKVEPSGCGPRHGVFYPSDAAEATHYLLVCELANLVNVYSLDYSGDELTFTEVQSISTFASGAAPQGAAAGEIVLAPNNRDLYVSNRLTGGASDTIAHFQVSANASSLLTLAGETPSGGVLPRMFSLNKDASELFVGNQNGPLAVAAFAVNLDGSLAAEPKASLDLGVFGAEGFGPPYIKQIR
jgi:6-phosphogluconolactonase (cycloisomerase 2 family)